MLKYRQLLLRLQWVWFIVWSLGVFLSLLFDGILEIIHGVQVRLEQDDVALRDVVGPQDTQGEHQDGTDLCNSPENCLQGGKNSDEEDPDDEVDEEGKRDPPGDVVLLIRRIHHEGAEEADDGQAAVVAMHQGKGQPGPGVTHQQNLAAQRLVVGPQAVRAQVEVGETEQALGEEAQGDDEPGPPLRHPGQESGGPAREFGQEGDLEGLGEEGGEAGVEAQGVDNLLRRTEPVAGLPDVEAGAEAQQRERGQGEEVPIASRSLHDGRLEVLKKEHRCQARQAKGDGRQRQQGDGERLVPEEVPLAAVVTLRAPHGGPLMLQAGGAGGAVCKVAARR